MTLKNTGSFEKWINLEYRKLNQNLVARPPFLSDLLKMDRPAAQTRGGEEYVFDLRALKELAKRIPDHYHSNLRLPIFFYSSVNVADSCYLADETAVEVLKHTNDLNQLYRFREGKLWISKPLAFELANKYPTLIQFVMQ
ncbi:MAG: DUF61 family protein [Thermoplasmata archaeon]|nr:MAG: DUF61 family protein [Thermoplasmata archaeon]